MSPLDTKSFSDKPLSCSIDIHCHNSIWAQSLSSSLHSICPNHLNLLFLITELIAYSTSNSMISVFVFVSFSLKVSLQTSYWSSILNLSVMCLLCIKCWFNRRCFLFIFQLKTSKLRKGRDQLMWLLLQFISGSIQKNQVRIFTRKCRLYRKLNRRTAFVHKVTILVFLSWPYADGVTISVSDDGKCHVCLYELFFDGCKHSVVCTSVPKCQILVGY